MNILIITGIFPPDIGGPASYVPAVARALSARGHGVSLITLSDTCRCRDSGYPFSVLRIQRSLPRLWRFLKTVLMIVKHGHGADLLFVHGLALEAVVANSILQKPLVQKVVGDLAWERFRAGGGACDRIEDFQVRTYGMRTELVKKLRAFWVARSSMVIVPSAYLKNIVLGWGVPEGKVRLVYNAVESEGRPAEAEPPPCCPEPGVPLIVSVGRLVPWKGFEELAGIMQNTPDARLVIVGEGPGRKRLEKLIETGRLQDRVHLAGRLTRRQVFGLLRRADLFVLNSSYEGFPHIVLEAMASGVAVIAADSGGTSELVRNGYNGLLVPPLQPAALKKAIHGLLRDEGARAKLVRGAHASLAKFSWSSLVDTTEGLLCEAVRRAAC